MNPPDDKRSKPSNQNHLNGRGGGGGGGKNNNNKNGSYTKNRKRTNGTTTTAATSTDNGIDTMNGHHRENGIKLQPSTITSTVSKTTNGRGSSHSSSIYSNRRTVVKNDGQQVVLLKQTILAKQEERKLQQKLSSRKKWIMILIGTIVFGYCTFFVGSKYFYYNHTMYSNDSNRTNHTNHTNHNSNDYNNSTRRITNGTYLDPFDERIVGGDIQPVVEYDDTESTSSRTIHDATDGDSDKRNHNNNNRVVPTTKSNQNIIQKTITNTFHMITSKVKYLQKQIHGIWKHLITLLYLERKK